jgi:formate dehydrogenase accessory protein FdhD
MANVVEEAPWWLEVNGRRVAGGTATPDHMKALAAGRLLADGFITESAELLALEIGAGAEGAIHARAQIPAARFANAEGERVHREVNGCGVLHFIACDPGAVRHARNTALPQPAELAARFRELFAAVHQASDVGGLHAAALTDGLVLMGPMEDVGRHNAVDKALGAALLERRALRGLGLVVTSRISAEIALKAARSGVAWLASRSIATSLAAALAEVALLPMIGRAASSEPQYYRAGVPGARL